MDSSSGTLETPVSLDGILQRLIDLEHSFTAQKEINKTLRINIEDIQNNYFDASMANDNLKRKIKNLTEDNTQLLDHVYELDCRIIKVEQYSRQESVEIMGIPDNISHNELEQTVLKIFHTIGATDIKSYDIAACHRLPKRSHNKYPANVIVRLMCRKNIQIIHQNKKHLYKCKNMLKPSSNIKIVENLCAANRSVLHECWKLKRDGVIHKYWTSNGFVRFKYEDNEDRPLQINHFDELNDLFHEYYEDE